MERLTDNAIEGDLEISVMNDPKFRKFILKKVKRGNCNIHRLVEELKRDPEFREAVRVRAEKLEQYDISLKHMPNDIAGYAQIGIFTGGLILLFGVVSGLSELEKNYDIYFGFFSTTAIYLAVLATFAYVFSRKN